MFSRLISVSVGERRSFYNVSGSSRRKILRFADEVAESLLAALRSDHEVVRSVVDNMAQRTAVRRDIAFAKLTDREARQLLAKKRCLTTYSLQ